MSTSTQSTKHRLILILSIVLLVFAAIAGAFQICSLVVGGRFSEVSTGIWSGILYASTGIIGLLSIRKANSSKLSWALCSIAVASCFGSIALVALSALGLGDNLQSNQENLLLLWIISNAFLIVVGIIGLVVCVTLAVVAPYNPKDDSTEVVMEEKRSVESNDRSIPKYPPSDVVAIVKPTSGGGLYEILESPRPSDIRKESEEYVLPYKSPKKSANSEDFEIQVDNGHEEKSSQKNRAHYNDWLTSPELSNNSKCSSSEAPEDEGWKTIQVPKEDILIHAPSSPNQKEHSTLNSDIPCNR